MRKKADREQFTVLVGFRPISEREKTAKHKLDRTSDDPPVGAPADHPSKSKFKPPLVGSGPMSRPCALKKLARAVATGFPVSYQKGERRSGRTAQDIAHPRKRTISAHMPTSCEAVRRRDCTTGFSREKNISRGKRDMECDLSKSVNGRYISPCLHRKERAQKHHEPA